MTRRARVRLRGESGRPHRDRRDARNRTMGGVPPSDGEHARIANAMRAVRLETPASNVRGRQPRIGANTTCSSNSGVWAHASLHGRSSQRPVRPDAWPSSRGDRDSRAGDTPVRLASGRFRCDGRRARKDEKQPSARALGAEADAHFAPTRSSRRPWLGRERRLLLSHGRRFNDRSVRIGCSLAGRRRPPVTMPGYHAALMGPPLRGRRKCARGGGGSARSSRPGTR
jgi:hypothetical protein